MSKLNRTTIIEILFATSLIALAITWRVINHNAMIMPNLELVTATSLLAAVFLRKPWGLAVPIATLFISDAIIGNSSIAFFTWSAFIVIALSGLFLRRFQDQPTKLIAGSAGMGLAAAIFFFLSTNFGVWLLGDGTSYPHTFSGLLLCYEMGIPFFRATLISGAVLTPALFAAKIYLPRLLAAKQARLAHR